MFVCIKCCRLRPIIVSTFPAAHPSCMGMTQHAAAVARGYAWQCLDCKTCQVCSDPDQEEKMVFCDDCDRGYHSFCLGLAGIPSGELT